MSARELPARPNLEQYKKQAKDLTKAFRSGDNSALQRVREHHPHAARDSFALADAKLVIAREHGGDSWPKFKQQIESASDRVPAAAWKTAEDAIVAGDVATLERILRDYGDMMRKERPQSSWNNTIQRRAADARSCTPVWQTDGPKLRNTSSPAARRSISQARRPSAGSMSCGRTSARKDSPQ